MGPLRLPYGLFDFIEHMCWCLELFQVFFCSREDFVLCACPGRVALLRKVSGQPEKPILFAKAFGACPGPYLVKPLTAAHVKEFNRVKSGF